MPGLCSSFLPSTSAMTDGCMTLQVTEETEAMRFNTGISAMMEFVNAAVRSLLRHGHHLVLLCATPLRQRLLSRLTCCSPTGCMHALHMALCSSPHTIGAEARKRALRQPAAAFPHWRCVCCSVSLGFCPQC
jgi:hypothetical protein